MDYTANNDDRVEMTTGPEPQFSVIWLHGLGADGHDFAPIVPELRRTAGHGVRFVFPHAPRRPITINGGMVMRGWYDVSGMEFDRREDADGVQASAAIVEELIGEQCTLGIPAPRIVLAGFSQGGAIALYAGLRYPERIGGILALSTYLPLAQSTQHERSAANRDVPIFMGHGLQDPLIPVSLAERSCAFLTGLGYDVAWHTYPMPHSVHPREIDDIDQWLNTRFRAG